jgi:hypothetical protein
LALSTCAARQKPRPEPSTKCTWRSAMKSPTMQVIVTSELRAVP